MELQLSAETIELLEKLATERHKTPTELIELLVKVYDHERHTIWSATKRQHVRIKCGYDDCFEVDALSTAGQTRD